MMKLRATRGSFTWQGRHVRAGQSFDVPEDYPHTDTLRRLYGAVSVDSARGRRTRRATPPEEPATVEEPAAEEGADNDG